jgi:mono/diheme cytochrome c family protein
MRRSRLALSAALIAVFLAFIALAAMAADAPADDAKSLDGKELFKTNCKVCHGPKAPAGTYTPMTLIAEQWDEFFGAAFAETHAKVAAPDSTEKKMVTDTIDKDMLEAIRKFCVDHAADSEQPMTCG